MKNIKNIFYVLAAFALVLGSCTKADNLMEGVVEGGLLSVKTSSINYVIGDAKDYNVSFMVYQSPTASITKVDAYIKFYTYKRNADGSLFLDADGAKVAISSNEKLLKSIDITETTNHLVSFSVNLTTLVDGLSVADNPFYSVLPTDDGQYLIGDYWDIRLVNTVGSKLHESAERVSVAVSTRFAGTYVCKDLAYYRLSVESPSYWVGHDLIIRSVDATTYSYDWGATIGWDGPLYFQIDPVTNVVSYPAEWDGVAQTLNGEALITPTLNPGDLTNVIPLTATPNIAIKDDVEGKDQLILVYGYYTSGSGPREFYEILEKKVD